MNAPSTFVAQFVPDFGDLVDPSRVTPMDYVWAGVTVVIGFGIATFARRVVRRIARGTKLPQNIVDFLGTVTSWLIMIVALVMAATFLGLTLAPLLMAMLLIFVVLFVAGQSYLANVGSGIIIQARAPFEVGDLVSVVGHRGIVKEVNTRVVILDTVENTRVFVPNSEVLAHPIINYTRHRLRRSIVFLDVEYGTDLDEACRVTLEALSGHEEVFSRPAPDVDVQSFESSSVRLEVRFWHGPQLRDEWTAIDTALRSIYDAFHEAGIKFAFPQATLWWGKGQQPPA